MILKLWIFARSSQVFSYNFSMSIIVGLVSGLLATVAMDFFALSMSRKKIIDLNGLQIVPPLLGRWLLNLIKTKNVFCDDIRSVPAQQGESKLGMIAHYLIGIFLGLVFILFLKLLEKNWVLDTVTVGIIFGLVTNIFPWLIMYPVMGFGLFARKLSITKQLLLFSYLNHFIYGVALGFIVKVLN